MTSPELLTLSSEEFHFNVSYTQASEAVVNFGNSSAEHYLAFKVRTMEPKMYTVKPSSGLIPPGETIPVKITFQGTKNESALEEFLKAKQAFQLQWREIYQVPSPADNAHSLMKPKNKEGGPLEQKLVPCRFELPPKQPDSAVPEEDSKEVYQTTESFEDTQDTQEPPPQPPSPSAPEKDESAKKPKSNSPPPYRSLREKEKKMLSTEGQQQQQSEEQQSSSPVNNAPAETAAAAEETAFKETESDVVPTAATASNDKSAAKDSNGNVTETTKENEAVFPVEKQPPEENLSTAKKLLSRISKAFEFAASPGKESVVPPSSPAKKQYPEPKQKAAEPAGKESEAVSPAKQLEFVPDKNADSFAKDSKQQPEKQTLVQSSAEPPKKLEIAPRAQQLDMSPGKDSNSSAKGQQQPLKQGSLSSEEKPHKKSEIAPKAKEPQTALGKNPDASGQQQQQVKSPPVESNVKPHEEAASSAKQNETAPDKDSGASSASEQQQQTKKDENPDDHQTFDLLTAFCALLVALFAAYIIFG